jgi:hypothetical protein
LDSGQPPNAASVSDIQGTFWIDRASNELRSLEFRYTNLPTVAERASPGGAVEFLRLPSGSWLVNRWHIRMPIVGVTASTTARGRGIRVSSSNRELSAQRIVVAKCPRCIGPTALCIERRARDCAFV